jgi:hypothetical protein
MDFLDLFGGYRVLARQRTGRDLTPRWKFERR